MKQLFRTALIAAGVVGASAWGAASVVAQTATTNPTGTTGVTVNNNYRATGPSTSSGVTIQNSGKKTGTTGVTVNNNYRSPGQAGVTVNNNYRKPR